MLRQPISTGVNPADTLLTGQALTSHKECYQIKSVSMRCLVAGRAFQDPLAHLFCAGTVLCGQASRRACTRAPARGPAARPARCAAAPQRRPSARRPRRGPPGTPACSAAQPPPPPAARRRTGSAAHPAQRQVQRSSHKAQAAHAHKELKGAGSLWSHAEGPALAHQLMCWQGRSPSRRPTNRLSRAERLTGPAGSAPGCSCTAAWASPQPVAQRGMPVAAQTARAARRCRRRRRPARGRAVRWPARRRRPRPRRASSVGPARCRRQIPTAEHAHC